jgi:hypothetical protein
VLVSSPAAISEGTMLDYLMHSENIVHIGALLYLAGFLFRDQLTLRGLIIVGDFV